MWMLPGLDSKTVMKIAIKNFWLQIWRVGPGCVKVSVVETSGSFSLVAVALGLRCLCKGSNFPSQFEGKVLGKHSSVLSHSHERKAVSSYFLSCINLLTVSVTNYLHNDTCS